MGEKSGQNSGEGSQIMIHTWDDGVQAQPLPGSWLNRVDGFWACGAQARWDSWGKVPPLLIWRVGRKGQALLNSDYSLPHFSGCQTDRFTIWNSKMVWTSAMETKASWNSINPLCIWCELVSPVPPSTGHWIKGFHTDQPFLTLKQALELGTLLSLPS